MRLTKIQEEAVEKLIEYYYNGEKLINFTAPTGSGKTFMIANFISKIIEENSNDKKVFIIFTLSNAELPEQFKNKLDSYQNFLKQKFTTYYYQSPSQKFKSDNDYYIKYSNNDVLIFGTSSFGKGKIFTELNRFKDFVYEAKSNNFKIIYIRDEAHIGDKLTINEGKTEQDIINKESNFLIKMTATPDSNFEGKNVFISEKKLNNEEDNVFLLKTSAHLNNGFNKDEIEDIDILETSIKKFIQIKKEYQKKSIEKNEIINPAMLIQIGSKNQLGEKINDNDKRIDEIIKIIEKNNLSWLIYFSDRKESSLRETGKRVNLSDISKNNSNIDVVIFKVGPAIGWDIPRACMLVQLRNVSSEKLNQQTVGRIKRNPAKNLEKDCLYDQYWIYSNHQEKTREIHKYKLKKEFAKIPFPSIVANSKNNYLTIEREKILWENKIFNFLIDNKQEIIDIYKETFLKEKKAIIVDFIKYKSENKNNLNHIITLNNILEIKNFNLDFIHKNNWINLDKLKYIYNNNFKKDIISFDHFILIIFRDYINDLTKIKKDFYFHKSEYSLNYENYLPSDYIVYEGKENDVDFSDIKDIYCYRYIMLENNQEVTKQFLDSRPESLFLNFFINKIIELDILDKIEMVAKNPLQSKIFVEYWNKNDSKYSRAYIDFVVKLKNKNEYLFIEVKSIDDYDKIKTESIKQEMINYSKTISNSKSIIHLCVVVVDKEQFTDKKRFDDYKNGLFTTICNDSELDININSIHEWFYKKVNG